MLAGKLNNLPTNPGCYLFKDKGGKIIYIGKAKNLKKRVSQYWQKKETDFKTEELVKKTKDVDFFITNSEVEALLLEAKLIRDHQPRFNIDLKDSVRYAYIKITKEDYPRLEIARKLSRDGQYFGPYPSGQARRQAILMANRIFKLRVCKHDSAKPCLLYHLGLVCAPAYDGITPHQYQERVAKTVMFLKGRSNELIKELEQEMKESSAQQKFELAKERREQLKALFHIRQPQSVQLQKTYNQDVIQYIQTPKELVVQLFNINQGIISQRQEYRLKSEATIEEFITQYYYSHEIPEEIIVPQELVEQKLIEQYLTKLKNKKVVVTVPKQGEKMELLSLAKKNLEISVDVGEATLLELQNILRLPRLPQVIECFDISQIQGTNVVGSMVSFHEAKPFKDDYRRFKIKTVKGQDDYASLAEIVKRRYFRVLQDKSPLPDLVMIDGGKGQLSAAMRALRELGLELPIISLAKREEEIYVLGSKYPLRLSKKSGALKLLQRIRDEAHRFAITFHRLRRSWEMTTGH